MSRRILFSVLLCSSILYAGCDDEASEQPLELEPVRTTDSIPSGENNSSEESDPFGNMPMENPNEGEGEPVIPSTGCAPATVFGAANEGAVLPAANCGDHFAKQGFYKAGVKTITLEGQPVEVWYPVRASSVEGRQKAVYNMKDWLPASLASQIPDSECTTMEMDAYRDATIEAGPFPVVLFSHGLAGYRMQSSAVMAHLATWGFVVAAPEHEERGLAVILETGTPTGDDAPAALEATLDLLTSLNENDATFGGRLDLSKVAAAGHSMGSAATAIVSQDSRISAWSTLAGAGFGDGPNKPVLMMGGSRDGLATSEVLADSFDRQPATQKRFVSVENAGHLAFTDICLIGRSEGGVLAIAQNYGLEVAEVLLTLANDGCQEDVLAAEYVFPVVNHYLVAHLRNAFGIDDRLRGFDDETRACFGDRVGELIVLGETDDPNSVDELPPLGGPDAEPIGVPAGPGLVCCGESGEVCDLGVSTCCSTWLGMACQPQCSVFALPQTCDGAEDCPNQKCCRNDDVAAPQGVFSFGATCKDSCEPTETELLVGVDMCFASVAPGAGVPNPQPDTGMMDSSPEETAGGESPSENTVGTADQIPGVVGEVACGASTCDVTTSVCCIGLAGAECIEGDTCAAFSAAQLCDGPEDCSAGEICCVGFPNGASCTANADCASGQNELCHQDSDCRQGELCLSCNPPGSPDPVNLCGATCPF